MWFVAITFVTNKMNMIHFEHILFSSCVIHGLLVILPKELMPEENFEEWLNNDRFVYSSDKYGEKKFLFTELEKLKSEFRVLISKNEPIVDEKGQSISAATIYNWIQLKKIQIEKVRLMIDHKLSYGTNLHNPTKVKYVVFRAYWIDKEGKKFRKFAKNIGPEDKVFVNGEVPQFRVKEIEKEIDRMMWEQYKSEYKE